MTKALELGDYRKSGGVKTLDDKFATARKNLKDNGAVKLPEVKLFWNPTILSPRKNGIGFAIPLCYDTPRVAGHIENTGEGKVCVSVDDSYPVPTGDCADRVIGYLNEAVGYASRLNILEDVTILPDKYERTTPRHDGPEESEIEYEKFFKTLVNMAKEINVGRENRVFGNCFGLKMPSGLFFAYDPAYAKAIYVVEKIEKLFQGRSELKESGDAIIFHRDMRGLNWEEKVLELAKLEVED